MRRVLVTGASGFIAQHLIPALAENGLEVIAASRTRPRGVYPGVDVRSVDVTDRESISGLASGCDTVVHLAGVAHKIGSVLGDKDFDRVNVDGTRNLLEESVRAGAARFLFLSSALVGGSSSAHPLTEDEAPSPADPYARSKTRAEQLVIDIVKNEQIWGAILRPPMVYGPGNRGNLPRLASLIARGFPLPFGAVSNARSVLFIDNLVRAISLVLEREPGRGNVFYVADDAPLSTASLAREIGAALGKPVRMIPVPIGVLTFLARAGDLMATFSRFSFTTRELNKLTGTLVVDDSKLRAATGYAPLVSTRDGIRKSFSPANQATDARMVAHP